MESGPLQPSGRVIASGRLLLATLFLIAVLADASQPARGGAAVYILLAAFWSWSLGVTVLVWKSWWWNARLAAPAHVIDIAVFMLVLYSTEGYTSPYFTFFIFILLAAAIRWGWKETAITALAVVAVYATVGLMMEPSPAFDARRFVIRTGHLVIISAILVWFGANQWVAGPRLGRAEDPVDPLHGDPFVAALRSEMTSVGARRGLLLWRETDEDDVKLVRISQDETIHSTAPAKSLAPLAASLLFDMINDRALARADASRWRFLRASQELPRALAKLLQGPEGLAIPLVTGAIEGVLVFQDVRRLSTDHLEFAPRVGREMAARLQEAALFAAIEERSMAKARVAVARDLHDSVVQFLAGLGFQLEALNRSAAGEGALGQSLAELKDTVMTEQRQLRAFIKGLRTGKPVSLHDLTRDCASLCALLSRQWNIDCECACTGGPGWVPVRTQLDIQHLVREAVANAVRHGEATHVTVAIGREGDELSLAVVDNGRGFGSQDEGEAAPPPVSLNGRVREALGRLEVRSSAAGTSVVIHLPLEEAA